MQGFIHRYFILYRSIMKKLNELLGEYELSYSLWMVIFYIEKYGPSTLVEISVFYNVEKPSITRTVHRLEEKQIIEQIPSKDRREKIIQLTPFGLEIYQETHGKIVELEHRLMKDIPMEDQHLVFQILPKIQENILEKEGNSNDQC